MAIPKRRQQVEHDSPPAKKLKMNAALNASFTLSDFMEDFPSHEQVEHESDSPLPPTVLSKEEMQHSAQNKPTLRSTFNITLPTALDDHDDASVQNAPYEWMKDQYAHCIIPELGEEYDFDFDSPTFHTLRDLHNARVRIRNGDYLPDFIMSSLATRWITLEEKDRPASEGYFANGDIFVATCLPLTDRDDGLEEYFEMHYSSELSAQHYIPRSKYSVHFVGEPNRNENREIQSVHVGSVLIRNSRTGDVIYIDTGAFSGRNDRAKVAGQVLRFWLEFQEGKCPEANLGPVSNSEPLVLLDVDKETHPSLRSLHAIVSASLFLRREITNWGEVKTFKQRFAPSSTTMANYALQNISGWLGLKSMSKKGEQRSKKTTKSVNTFKDNYNKGALLGRERPAPESERITSASRGEAPVYNEETESGDDVSDHDESSSESSAEGSVDGSHDSADDAQDTLITDPPSNNEELNDEESNEEKSNNKVAENEKSASEEPATPKSALKGSANKESSNKKSVSWEEPEQEQAISKEPESKEFSSKEPTDEEANGNAPSHKNLNDETSGHDVDSQTSSAPV